MDLKAKYLSETCSDPIVFLNQLRQTTEPIGGGTVYSEDGELVEYDVAIEAVKKANDAFIKKACEFLKSYRQDTPDGTGYIAGIINDKTIDDFVNYMKGEEV